MKLMDDLLFLLRALDDKTNSRVLGAVTATDFEGMMRDYFHSKPEDQILEMLAAAEEDLLVKAPTQWEQKVRRRHGDILSGRPWFSIEHYSRDERGPAGAKASSWVGFGVP